MTKNRAFIWVSVATVLGVLGWVSTVPSRSIASSSPVTRNFHMVAVGIKPEGAKKDTPATKFWFPSTLIVKKGDRVKIHAVSQVATKNNVHGLTIDAFGIEALVDEKGKEIEFVADKAGIFDIRCQIHPPHVGGQLVVME